MQVDLSAPERYFPCRSDVPESFIFEPTYFEAGAYFCCRRHALRGEGGSGGGATILFPTGFKNPFRASSWAGLVRETGPFLLLRGD